MLKNHLDIMFVFFWVWEKISITSINIDNTDNMEKVTQCVLNKTLKDARSVVRPKGMTMYSK